MSTIGLSGPEALVKDPAEARFLAEVLAECAANGSYTFKRAYAALRSLSPPDLFELYSTWKRDGNDGFRAAFGPYYHRARGEDEAGPLFAKELEL
jgi:hypothetical protein